MDYHINAVGYHKKIVGPAITMKLMMATAAVTKALRSPSPETSLSSTAGGAD
jgi:regulator of RNase E activity RraA